MSLRPMFMAFAVGILACGTESDIADQTALPEVETALNGSGYRISGTVFITVDGGPARPAGPNWTVNLTGGRPVIRRSTRTDAYGYYAFSGLANGSYFLSVSVPPLGPHTNYFVSPRLVVLDGANVANIDFTIRVQTAPLRLPRGLSP